MDTQEVKGLKLLGNLFSASLAARGGIIDGATQVENILTDIIAWCFFPTFEKLDEEIDNQLEEKGIILKSLILRKLEFEDKINMLKDLIIVTNEELWNNNIQLIKEIRKELHKIQEFRNLLAHSPLDTSKEYRNQLTKRTSLDNIGFQILEYKGTQVKKHNIDENKIKVEVERIRVTWHKLLQLFALLKNDIEDARACEALANAKEEDLDKALEHLGFNIGVERKAKS